MAENDPPQPDADDEPPAANEKRSIEVSQRPARKGAGSARKRDGAGSLKQTGTRRAGGGSAGADAALAKQLERLTERVQKGKVEFHDVVRLTYWQDIDRDDPRHALGTRYADEAREQFKGKHGGEQTRLAVYSSGTGVYLTPDGVFRWLIARSAIVFDFSEAHRLIYDIDAVAEQAREWWEEEVSQGRPAARGTKQRQGGRRRDRRRRAWVARARAWRASAGQSALRPHLDRAYMLTTSVLAAIQMENSRQRKALEAEPKKMHEPSEHYVKNLALARAELNRAQALLQKGGQRSAQVRYGLGMICGAVALMVLSLVLGAIFLWWDVPAYYAVAVPTGGIGAVVSVLQRMTSGRLKLDVHAGRVMLIAYGAVRPLIGAVFGMVVFVLIAGDLLPAISVSEDAPLAFYAGVGFIAGFSERFAQDMLAGASMQSSPDGSNAP